MGLKIKNARDTKLGDYKKSQGTHQITLNYGMHKELSFLTLTHEIAHMHAFQKYGSKIKPHGQEWKHVFTGLILESVDLYSKDFQPILLDFAKNPRAGFYSYQPIVEYFHLVENEEVILLKNIAVGVKFRLKNKIFKKGDKRKIRYICTELKTGKKYTIHPLAPVDEIIEI